MPVMKGLEWTFDTVAKKYAKYRPGYTDDLYKMIFDYVPLDSKAKVVEVGIGGGQATLPILQTGCALTAIEPGENFSDLCKEKYMDYPNFSVKTGKFENIDFEEEQYDLVYSASAFHWIPEEAGYEKVYRMLRKGGAFARFANHPYKDKGNTALSEKIERLYDEYYYKYYDKNIKSDQECSYDQAKERAEIAGKYGFEDIRYALFHRTRAFIASEYIELLGTYSDHINIEESIRVEFFSKIEEAINEHGGVFNIYDTIDLQLARKM